MTTIKDSLVYINSSKKDDCKIANLNQNWKKILSHYMATHYLRCVSYDMHNSYFIAIDCIYDDCVDDDTIKMLNRVKVTIYSIDYIVDCIIIKFKDEKSRNLIMNVLKGEVA